MAAAEQALQELAQRVASLEAYVMSNQIPDPRDGQPPRNMYKILIDMEAYLKTLIDDPPMQTLTMGTIIDEKLKTAMSMQKGNNPDESWFNKSVLESKAIQDIGPVVDAKQY